MLNNDDYEILNSSFCDSQRLFNKLNQVATGAAELDYDESGLYQEDEEMYERHWLKLSSKIVDALSIVLKGYNIELLKNDSLEMRELTLNLIKNEEQSKIRVDYAKDDTVNIIQIS